MNTKISVFSFLLLLQTFTLTPLNAKVDTAVTYFKQDEVGNHGSGLRHKQEHLSQTSALTVTKVDVETDVSVEDDGSSVNGKDDVVQRNLKRRRRKHSGR